MNPFLSPGVWIQASRKKNPVSLNKIYLFETDMEETSQERHNSYKIWFHVFVGLT